MLTPKMFSLNSEIFIKRRGTCVRARFPCIRFSVHHVKASCCTVKIFTKEMDRNLLKDWIYYLQTVSYKILKAFFVILNFRTAFHHARINEQKTFVFLRKFEPTSSFSAIWKIAILLLFISNFVCQVWDSFLQQEGV